MWRMTRFGALPALETGEQLTMRNAKVCRARLSAVLKTVRSLARISQLVDVFLTGFRAEGAMSCLLPPSCNHLPGR